MVDQMQNRRGAHQQYQPQQPQMGNGGGINAGFMEWLQGILSMGDQYQLTEGDIANLGNYMLYQQAYGQEQQYDLANREYDLNNRQVDYQNRQLDTQGRELDYKDAYLRFQHDELGLRGKELDYALQQLEFQSGPHFEFYKENEIQKLKAATQMSQDDVYQSANHLQQTRLNTDIAAMNRDMARFQMAEQMGLSSSGSHYQPPKVMQQFSGY